MFSTVHSTSQFSQIAAIRYKQRRPGQTETAPAKCRRRCKFFLHWTTPCRLNKNLKRPLSTADLVYAFSRKLPIYLQREPYSLFEKFICTYLGNRKNQSPCYNLSASTPNHNPWNNTPHLCYPKPIKNKLTHLPLKKLEPQKQMLPKQRT